MKCVEVDEGEFKDSIGKSLVEYQPRTSECLLLFLWERPSFAPSAIRNPAVSVFGESGTPQALFFSDEWFDQVREWNPLVTSLTLGYCVAVLPWDYLEELTEHPERAPQVEPFLNALKIWREVPPGG
ncbi:MAG: hypothetical protein AAB601_02190 [Patescibacteria group bacterium]